MYRFIAVALLAVGCMSAHADVTLRATDEVCAQVYEQAAVVARQALVNDDSMKLVVDYHPVFEGIARDYIKAFNKSPLNSRAQRENYSSIVAAVFLNENALVFRAEVDRLYAAFKAVGSGGQSTADMVADRLFNKCRVAGTFTAMPIEVKE